MSRVEQEDVSDLIEEPGTESEGEDGEDDLMELLEELCELLRNDLAARKGSTSTSAYRSTPGMGQPTTARGYTRYATRQPSTSARQPTGYYRQRQELQ